MSGSEYRDERLRSPRFLVHWQGRSMLADRSVIPAVVKTASLEGLGVEMAHAISLGKDFNLEFFVNFSNKKIRLRTKLTVIYCMILSGNRGVYMEARVKQMADDDAHSYNTILQALGSAKEFDLRI